MKPVTPSRIVALVITALVLCGALATCGAQQPLAASHSISSPPTGEVLYVVDGTPSWESSYTTGQKIVAFHPGSAATSPLVSLPMGLTTLDHQRIYAATAAAGETTITVYDTHSGARLSTFTIAGAYSMDGRGYAGAVLSPDGHWLVLRQVGEAAGSSVFALVDTQAHRLAQTIALAGDFDLDAISPGGTMLYLLQNLSDAAHHYYVRAYDLTARNLLQTIIVDKSAWNEATMTGSALTRQMAPNGSIAYTLYTDLASNRAFVHILPLGEAANYFPFARCIDLPAGTSADLLRYYTLALSPDGAMLYAANAALGVMRTISLHGQDIYSDQIETTGHFAAVASEATPGASTRMLFIGAALSADGRTLYVVGVHGIQAIRTSDQHVVGTYAAQHPFTGVALSANGTLLYAADPANGLTVIPLAGGSMPYQLHGPVQSPWGIAWVSA